MKIFSLFVNIPKGWNCFASSIEFSPLDKYSQGLRTVQNLFEILINFLCIFTGPEKNSEALPKIYNLSLNISKARKHLSSFTKYSWPFVKILRPLGIFIKLSIQYIQSGFINIRGLESL